MSRPWKLVHSIQNLIVHRIVVLLFTGQSLEEFHLGFFSYIGENKHIGKAFFQSFSREQKYHDSMHN